MKNLKRISIIIFIILCCFVNKSFADYGRVNIQAARVRQQTNTNSKIIMIIYENDVVEILETNNDWCKIKYDGKTGYVKKQYLSGTKVDQSSNSTNSTSENKANTTSENKTNNTTLQNNTNNVKTENNTNTQNNVNVDNTNNNSLNETSKNNNTELEEPNNQKFKISSAVNVRLLPNITSNAIIQLEQGKEITKISEIKNWIKITDGNIQGWIPQTKILLSTADTPSETPKKEEKPKESEKEESKVPNQSQEPETTINKTGKINVETAKVREKANTSSSIVAFLDYNDTVTIIAEEGDWYKISSEGISGYVSKKLVKTSVSSRSLIEGREDIDISAISKEENNSINETLFSETEKSTNSVQVAEYAKQFLGKSYVLGGKTPETGFDCSGFTKYVFSNFGYSLGSTAASQNNLGEEVSKDNLQPGDLILFYDEGKNKIGHTGIYVGEGNFVHAANAKRGVVTDNINTNSYYNTRFVTARRIVK